MAANFKLFLHKTSDSMHVKMWGDFDGSSAHELLKAIQTNAPGAYQVFIDTENLDNIYSFGKQVFQNNLGAIRKQSQKLIFIGRNQNSFNF